MNLTSVDRSRRLWPALVLLLLGYVFYAVNQIAWSVLLPELRAEFSLTAAMAGGIASAFLIGQMITTLIMGAVSDFASRRFLLAFGVAVFSLFAVATGLAREAGDLLLYRLLVGMGLGIYAVTIFAYVGQAFTKYRGTMLGLITMCYSVGGFIGPWYSGAVASSHGWRMPFTQVGVVGLLLAVVLFLVVPEIGGGRTARAGREPLSTRREPLSLRRYFREALQVIPTRNVFLAILINLITGISFWVFVVWTPTYFRETLGFDIVRAGFAAGLWPAGSIIGSVVGGWISDRIGRRATIAITGLLAGLVSYLLFGTGLAVSYGVVCVLTFLFGTLIASLWVIPLALAQDTVGVEHIGMTTGIVQFAQRFTGVFSPPLFGALMASLGMAKMLAVGVTLPYALTGLLILLAVDPKRAGADGKVTGDVSG